MKEEIAHLQMQRIDIEMLRKERDLQRGCESKGRKSPSPGVHGGRITGMLQEM